MRRVAILMLLAIAGVGLRALAENSVELTLESSAKAESAFIVFIDGGQGGCRFQGSASAVRDGGLGPQLIFGTSTGIVIPVANATCATLASVALKCAKAPLGLDGGGCP